MLRTCAFLICLAISISAGAQQATIPQLLTGSISGTVLDVSGEIVPGAKVILEGAASEPPRTTPANDNAYFIFDHVELGTPYRITISADGLASWTSSTIILTPERDVLLLTDINLKIAGGVQSVTVYADSTEIATQQVHIEEQQRVLGFIPNFYVVYDPNAVALTKKLKFSLALRASTDPVTFIGEAFLAGIDQAANTPDYVEGAKGYGQRLGAAYADGFTDIMIGGAILPSLLHQDTRYFYQGTGTTKSRAIHALTSPFICKGDNGRWQPNYSSVGGDLASGALSNAYYPATNRGLGLVFVNAAITTAGRMTNGLIQEFVLRRLTPSARNHN